MCEILHASERAPIMRCTDYIHHSNATGTHLKTQQSDNDHLSNTIDYILILYVYVFIAIIILYRLGLARNRVVLVKRCWKCYASMRDLLNLHKFVCEWVSECCVCIISTKSLIFSSLYTPLAWKFLHIKFAYNCFSLLFASLLDFFCYLSRTYVNIYELNSKL